MRQIIYVNVLGGPPFDYVVDRLKLFGEVHVVQPETMSAEEEAQLRALVDDVRFVCDSNAPEGLQRYLIDLVHELSADALVTFDEFSLRDVSAAATVAGLRGAGRNVFRSVNKAQIYGVLQPFDLLKRPFVASTRTADLVAAPIPSPFVVKPAECAGSVGVFAVRNETDPESLRTSIERARHAVQQVIETMWASPHLKDQQLIREGMLVGDGTAWFGDDCIYADYISVEGVILDGRYFPLAITQNHPLIDPFIETVSLSPSTLPFDRQRDIVARITPCLESFGLQNCGVHTEIKLLPGDEIAIIETAARFAGWSIIPQIESVFGIDPIGFLVSHLLDRSVEVPPTFDEIYARRAGSAATINLLPVTPSGEAWDDVVFRGEPTFSGVINPSSNATFTPYISVGEVVKAFNPYDGAWNSIGKVFLESRDIDTLNSDIGCIRSKLRDLIS